MAIRITVEDSASSVIARIIAQMSQENIMPVLERVAMESFRRLIIATPKGFTGITRKRWRISRLSRGFLVTNTSKVMRYLELGTPAHGPTTKKFLYIPLNRKAAIGGWNESLKYGVDYILAKWVRGITPMRIVQHERTVARQSLRLAMNQFLHTAIQRAIAED